MSRRVATMGFAVAIIIAAAAMIWIALGFDSGVNFSSSMLGGHVMPIVLMSGLIVGAVLLLLREFQASADQEPLFVDRGALLRPLAIAVLLIAAVLLWETVGFFVVSAAFGLTTSAVLGVRSPWIYVIAAGFGPLAGIVFQFVLGIQL